MNRLTLLDSMFLGLESPEIPAHVAGLQIYELPRGKGSAWLHGLMAELRQRPPGSPFNEKLHCRLGGLPELVVDEDYDPEYHLRHTVLPRPGTDEQLRSVLARLQAHLIDRDRPLWEFHLIEGLENRRFAFYIKIHHAICDGATFSKWMSQATTRSAASKDMRPIWQRPRMRASRTPRTGLEALQAPVNMLATARDLGLGLGQLGGKLLQRRFLQGDRSIALPLSSPSTALSAPPTASRNLAFTHFPLADLKAMGKPSGATLNDVVLALCDAALRRFLAEQGQVPEQPLVALVPVNLRQPGSEEEGNLVTSIQVKLGDRDQGHAERLAAVRDAMRSGKALYTEIPTVASQAYSLGAAGLGAIGTALHLEGIMPPPCNLIISNVPGPRETRYFGGARLLETYPISGIAPMSALNVTVYSYDGELFFGLVAGRRALPHLHDLKLCIDEVYDEFHEQLLGAD
ncbi:wax ester/triacylglycerol synthase family O-acyltransferase [Seongchinamella sediminis]|nr:wax ester/triacylglycerol synthase family O-acyltransferase [Seongchinamella sediminis]